MKLMLKRKPLLFSVVTGVGIICGSLTSLVLISSEAYACNTGLGKLDPTCPGRILNPRSGGTAPSQIPTQVNLGLSRETIVSSYQVAFGRNPRQNEINYWISRSKQERVDTNVLLINHRNYLREGGDLDGTIMRSYQTILSRNPNFNEMNYWRQRIRADRLIYADLVQAHQNWVRNGGR